MFDRLIEILKANPRKIVFTEGPDARILEAADRLKKDGFLTPILIGAPEEVKAAAVKGGFDIEGLEIIDPATYPGMDEMVEKMVVLRKGKMTAEQCREALSKGNYFGTMLVKMGYADALLGGATYSTADTVRPALQLVKTKPGAHLVSSCFILSVHGRRQRSWPWATAPSTSPMKTRVDKEGNVVVSAADKLAEVAVETARCAQTLRHRPEGCHAELLHEGLRQGRHGCSCPSDATAKAKELAPDLAIDGEMQFDAAVSPVVGQLKFPGSKVAGYANTFIFPCIEAGNIGYKIAQRLGGYRGLRPHPARPERPDQRPLPRLQRRRGLQDGHHHGRPCVIRLILLPGGASRPEFFRTADFAANSMREFARMNTKGG